MISEQFFGLGPHCMALQQGIHQMKLGGNSHLRPKTADTANRL